MLGTSRPRGRSQARRGAVGRYLAVGLGLFAVYAATLGIDSFGTSRYAGDEPHVLRAAKAIVDHGRLTTPPRDKPREVGLPLLIAPAYALGGPTLVELELAAFAALAFVLAVALARRLVPEPWATAAPVVCGLSPPALAYATAIDPVMVAGAFLATAVVFALRARERPRLVEALGCGAALAVLPWLGTLFLVPAAVIGAVLFRWLWRRHRGWFGLVALEVLLASLVAFATVNERLFSRLTPVGDWTRLTGADSAVDYLDRAYRLVALWIDRDYGLLRWAPVFALAFVAVWLLWRSLRDRVARTLPERKDVEAAAGLLVLVCAAAGDRRGVPDPDDGRLLVPGAGADRGAAVCRGAVRVGAAPRAAVGERRAGRADAGGERLAVRRAAARRHRLVRADLERPVGPARGRLPRVRHRLALRDGGDRSGGSRAARSGRERVASVASHGGRREAFLPGRLSSRLVTDAGRFFTRVAPSCPGGA